MEQKFMRSPKFGQAALRSHRGMFEIAAAAGLTIAGCFAVLGDPAAPARAQGAGVASDALMAGDALPDVAVGAKDAPVTIVEYASMTCGTRSTRCMTARRRNSVSLPRRPSLSTARRKQAR